MDDLGQVLRDLNHAAISHSVYYFSDVGGGAYRVNVLVARPHVDASFVWNGHWDLRVAVVNGNRETITGLLNSIQEA